MNPQLQALKNWLDSNKSLIQVRRHRFWSWQFWR